MTFAEKLREVMKEQNISQSDLSRLTKIGRSSISQYLSDRNIPTPQRQEEIAVALKLPEDYFTAEENAVKACISRAKVSLDIPMILAAWVSVKRLTFALEIQAFTAFSSAVK